MYLILERIWWNSGPQADNDQLENFLMHLLRELFWWCWNRGRKVRLDPETFLFAEIFQVDVAWRVRAELVTSPGDGFRYFRSETPRDKEVISGSQRLLNAAFFQTANALICNQNWWQRSQWQFLISLFIKVTLVYNIIIWHLYVLHCAYPQKSSFHLSQENWASLTTFPLVSTNLLPTSMSLFLFCLFVLFYILLMSEITQYLSFFIWLILLCIKNSPLTGT